MYLSQLRLDPRSRVARGWVADCHAMHRAVMSAFADVEPSTARAELGVLYRVDFGRDATASVLVQSSVEPDWSGLPVEATTSIARPKAVGEAYGGIAAGNLYRFRLRANPTRRVSRWAAAPGSVRGESESAVGKRVELRDEAEQLAWLGRQGGRLGFALRRVQACPPQPGGTVPDTRADPGGRMEGRKPGWARDRKMTLGTALFEGILEVTDGDRLRAAIAEGIGPGKAFGCGLLSLAPVEG